MKKIDILNFITSYRKAPNDVKTYHEILSHLGEGNEPVLNEMLNELKQLRVLKETEANGVKSYQVAKK